MEHSQGTDGNDRPCVLVTNDDGIHAPGLRALVSALVDSGACQVFVCAPVRDQSGVSHSLTIHENLVARSIEIKGAIAYAVSGTPADCVSLSLSGVLFPPIKPSLVLSGINKGCNCGYHIYYSGTVAGAREAVICGVPAISLSLNWNRRESVPSDFAAAAGICLPLIKAALRDLDKGILSASLFLNIDIPTSPSNHKGFKVTKQGTARYPLRWRTASPQVKGGAIAAGGWDVHSTMSVEGKPLAESSPFGNTEIADVHFCIDYTLADTLKMGSDDDFGAVESGLVAVTPLALVSQDNSDFFNQLIDWISTL
ncbi:hypothetical protein GOP47_0030221 [Adiantum capillus-veneris]|nr:hypothetical protein GOP47_0030221 [Adiantum capillus-veneris]